MKLERVIITGGGTGGHLFPGLTVAEELKIRNPRLRLAFLGSKKGIEAREVPLHNFEFYPVSCTPPKGILWPLKNIWGFAQSLGIMKKFAPQLVVGSGGYISVPPVLAAAFLKIPVVLLEQNVIPGVASKFLSRFAARVCLSFSDSAWGKEKSKFIWTGNPIRPEIFKAKKQESRKIMGINVNRKCLLITGASQGAKSINRALLKALPEWKNYPWEVIHLTGNKDFNLVNESAPALIEGGVLNYYPYAFLEDMPSAYASADLVVSRAGATTLAEITACGLPAVLVPYPYAKAHQTANAAWLADLGGAMIIPDEKVEEELREKIAGLMNNEEILSQMAQSSLKAGRPEAVNNVIKEMEFALERRTQ